MHYVIHVGAGNESRAEALIRHMVQENLCTACFYPTKHLKKKIRGTWRHIYQRLLPGYLFIESSDIRSLYRELREIPIFLHLLGKEELYEETDFYPLTETEELWLEKLMELPDAPKQGEHVIELSQVGFDENDQVVILDGPLKKLEGQIKKINLHKRTADVELWFMGEPRIFQLGIELLQKKPDPKNPLENQENQ